MASFLRVDSGWIVASFLSRIRAGVKLSAFALLAGPLMAFPLEAPGWRTGAAAALLLGLSGELTAAALARRLFQWRWLLLAIVLLHALLTPGRPLTPWMDLPSREGLFIGLGQGARVGMLMGLAWAMGASTPPSALASALADGGAALGWKGAARWSALALYTLGRLPFLRGETVQARWSLAAR
ncbi:MAG: hypothetical protein HQL51_16805, partial [Magnetococcales bacterium]|nr:hypothetical protein [Magnetococcales bacterium]